MLEKTIEANIDSLVGLTHFYGGLAIGNLASLEHRFAPSHPRQAALQGLEKMLLLMRLGIPQLVLPPHERPDIEFLKKTGFTGKDEEILQKAYKESPALFYAACSSSFMWAANAATVTPSSDSRDGKVHITPANLSTHLHRSLETPFTSKLLRTIFHHPVYFHHHAPLPTGLPNEGAANHTRFANGQSAIGIHLFVYGKTASSLGKRKRRYFPREVKEAEECIARKHLLDPRTVIFAEQNPTAIDAGVFHNDVISTGNETLFICHEKAFLQQKQLFKRLQKKIPLRLIEVKESEISLNEAVKSYFFNSQLVTLPNGKLFFIAPKECSEMPSAARYLNRLKDELDAEIAVVDLRESMQNGGGPACLRLRMVLKENELRSCCQGVLLTEELGNRLKKWIMENYREILMPKDLLDPALLDESKRALEELLSILSLPPLYPFQGV